MDGLRGSVAQVDANGQSIQQLQNQAAYQLAIGTGQDFVTIAGQEVPIPVNTVLRRQSSATLRRYEAALTNAKALAYMARRAIEQRIGVTLETLTQQVGPVDAPHAWADDICGLQGVNLASLSSALPADVDGGGIDGSADQQAITRFADAWVGDYVAKLQNFVTYYNVQYPSHQGEDTAVLSLRYDLLGPAPQCTIQGPNLLVNSGDMSRDTPGGWKKTACDATLPKCLAVLGGFQLAAPQDGPWGAMAATGAATLTRPDGVATGITWLTDVPQLSAPATKPPGAAGAFGADAGAGVAPGGVPVASSAPERAPNNVVMQSVNLAAGSYVLSWWDQARDANGNVLRAGTGATPVPYVVEMLDPSVSRIVVSNPVPFTPLPVGDAGAPPLWSARNTLSFTVANAGSYTVAFSASSPGSPSGSVAIAGVQLERAPMGQPTAYLGTGDTTLVQGRNCPMSDADLRSAFTHNCNNTGVCSFDLKVPLIIDTTDIGPTSPLGAKLAAGNNNYRHLTLAVNLVGTGVHTCTNDPNDSCLGSGYIQYDLQHDGTSAGIIGFDGNSRIFDFGIANIFHGKALSAERYLTLPLGASDQSLVSQSGIQHVEFSGRPLDGTYHLRIWDSPDLNWSALQDIQLYLSYEYWSPIAANGNVQQH
jgi:hypothetical protein